mmetsp:Transcript_26793/g.89716  ORF Transcript_26793/g.89716 Transcript_26793/m.89716 type:complete len:114 (-) Transcript_26793:301-642(-)|eukprot:CAMPEP_0206014810 /NCGR_PEP_ID=MMETSP1464-20131121/18936_1 /ASSEMBLY_ACC=CAM_ASM_001124 /TAXON_ID=119497 /ORGANISM="Exanthemachrysis gayraliae, Strain RCC1523" /LENGTH=113 /DNA_ID=CAMNT_0053388577 /DNA_START=8 /DNA_END=349 /DNA_ORIENTATION=+
MPFACARRAPPPVAMSFFAILLSGVDANPGEAFSIISEAAATDAARRQVEIILAIMVCAVVGFGIGVSAAHLYNMYYLRTRTSSHDERVTSSRVVRIARSSSEASDLEQGGAS